MQQFTRACNRAILFVTEHWLALVNAMMALILGLAFLAPWLMLHGHAGAGQLVHLVYRPLCHQLPERSVFVGGERPLYSLAELSAHLGYTAPRRWVGDEVLGFKSAVCQRDIAIFAGWLLAGLAFVPLRRRLRRLSWQGLLLSMAPVVLDGLPQLFGLWESNWWRRGLTGLIFAVGVVCFAFPLIEMGMKDARLIALQALEGGDAPDR